MTATEDWYILRKAGKIPLFAYIKYEQSVNELLTITETLAILYI